MNERYVTYNSGQRKEKFAAQCTRGIQGSQRGRLKCGMCRWGIERYQFACSFPQAKKNPGENEWRVSPLWSYTNFSPQNSNINFCISFFAPGGLPLLPLSSPGRAVKSIRKIIIVPALSHRREGAAQRQNSRLPGGASGVGWCRRSEEASGINVQREESDIAEGRLIICETIIRKEVQREGVRS